MSDSTGSGGPSPEEIARADKAAREFLERVVAVPSEHRRPITSERFTAPIAEAQAGERASNDDNGPRREE